MSDLVALPTTGRQALIAIVGPTGSGKSHLALELALALGGEIVNFDSVQLYSKLDIGSAKVRPEERRGIRHHLIDVLAPDAVFSAGQYARLARGVLEELRLAGTLPVLTGGTGFYLRALVEGLPDAPDRDEQLRTRLQSMERRTPGRLRRLLNRWDPSAARRIHANDRQKTVRALERTILARRPATHVLEWPRTGLTGYRLLKLGLYPPRAQLYERIDRRTESMFNGGLIEEVRELLAAGLSPRAKSLEALGYAEVVRVIEESLPVTEAIRECQAKTRQYAKRQLTWFRHEPGVVWLEHFGEEVIARELALDHARKFLHGSHQ